MTSQGVALSVSYAVLLPMDSAWDLCSASRSRCTSRPANNVMVAASAANHAHPFDRAAHVRHRSRVLGDADLGVRGSRLRAGELAGSAAAVPLAGCRVACRARLADRDRAGTRRGRPRPHSRFPAAAFQWVNPKAWLIAAGAAGEYLSPNHPLRCSLHASSWSSSPSACRACWCGRLSAAAPAGCCIRPHALRAFNIAMALLLVASLVPVLIEG